MCWLRYDQEIEQTESGSSRVTNLDTLDVCPDHINTEVSKPTPKQL